MRFKIIVILFLFILLGGCSSGWQSPSMPSGSATDSPFEALPDNIPVFVSDYSPDGSPREGMGIMGLFHLILKPDNAELVPLRKTALEDVLEVVDITNFLSMAPCTNCVKIKSIALDPENHLVATIGIKHPFPAGDPLKPITGRNRADLHVFNVEGIVLSNAPAIPFNGLHESIAGFELLSADGYTSYLDGPIDEIFQTDATIHPYIMHFDYYGIGNFDAMNPTGFFSVTDPGPSENLVMAMGCDYNYQDYVFDLDDIERMDFVFAVGCTYAVSSASKSQRFTPEYRVPQHNKKAASEVRVEITRNELASGATTSEADLEIQVLDINHGVPVGTALNEMRADSSVGKIEIDIPNVLNTPFNASIAPTGGDGRDPNNPLTFAATITNELGAGIGMYSGLVKVTDACPVGLNASPLLSGKDAIERVDPLLNPLTGLYDLDEFATYATFTIDISSSNLPPIVELLSSCSALYTGGRTVLSVGPGTYDPDGNNLVRYEYDFDYQAPVFDIDASNITGDPVTTTPIFNTTTSPVMHTFGLRITDDGVPIESGIGTIQIPLYPAGMDGKNIPLRQGSGAEPRDIGIIETTGEILVGFSDNQVWKYSPDYSTGAMFYELYQPSYTFDLLHLDVTKTGYSLVRSDMTDCSFTYSPTGSLIWRYINQGIKHTAGLTNLDGPWFLIGSVQIDNRLIMLTDWEYRNPPIYPDVRWFQITYYPAYNGFSGWFSTNGSGIGTFSSFYTVAFDFKRDVNQYWILEGEPRYELELFQFYANYLNKTIGLDGAQSDDLNGFYDPKDVVTDSTNRVYVLDKLSNDEPCIKLYDAAGDPVARFGFCGKIGGDPIALDPDEGDGEIHVIHSNGVSIFYPGEIP